MLIRNNNPFGPPGPFQSTSIEAFLDELDDTFVWLAEHRIAEYNGVLSPILLAETALQIRLEFTEGLEVVDEKLL